MLHVHTKQVPQLFHSKTAMIPVVLQLVSFLSILVVRTSVADQLSFAYHECNNILGNFTPGSAYSENRNTLLSNIYSDQEIDYGFYNFSYGEGADKVNGIGLCRGDLNPDDCRKCLQNSAVLLIDRCQNQEEAIGWYDTCMLRYSNRSIFGAMETRPNNVLCNNITVGDADAFNKVVNDLLDRLMRSAAVSGDSRRKVAAGNAALRSSNDAIYALLQCTPDLSEQSCTQCLNSSFSMISNFCDGKKGARYIGPSCSVRYENYTFFGPIQGQGTAPAPQPPGKSNALRTAVAIVVPVVALVSLLIIICIYLRVRKHRDEYIASEGEREDEVDNDIKTTELMQFDFETIRVATDNFSDANKLGRGGFGTVYKGSLSNEEEVAIKRLSHNSGQGETEFKNEVLLTGKLQHRNLVRLLGFCLERKERLLIYEFVPNKSLDYIIFDPIKRANLDWEIRYKIINGIARGLLYLHEDSRLQIIHRDLKTSNILLDDELNPKISDFGIARLFNVNQTPSNTNTIVGTFGYMAPEYIMHGRFSIKSDIFSFGVIILEILCGQKNGEIRRGDIVENLLSFVWRNWREGTASNVVDPTLNHGSRNEIMRCIHIGLLCVQEDIADRPTMTVVLSMLNSISVPLPDPSEPPFLMRGKRLLTVHSGEQYSEATRSSDSGNQSVPGTTNNAQITDVYPR